MLLLLMKFVTHLLVNGAPVDPPTKPFCLPFTISWGLSLSAVSAVPMSRSASDRQGKRGTNCTLECIEAAKGCQAEVQESDDFFGRN